MTRTVTAIFETYDVAQTVRREIEDLGVRSGQVLVIPDSSGPLDVDAIRSDEDVAEINYLNVPTEDMRTYQQAVREGHYVVSADIDDDHVQHVMEIMRHPERGGIDIDAYESTYRERDDYDEAVVPLAGYERTETDGDEHIQLAEERIRVGKRSVEHGAATVRTYVQEVPVEERIRLREEHVSVHRRPTDRVVTGAEADGLFQERVIEVSETSEEAVIDKETVITEEIVVSRETSEREEVVRDTVRKTEVEVDETGTRMDRDKPRL